MYGVPTIILARTDAEAADLLTSDCDENDKPFCTGCERTVEGFYKTRKGWSRRYPVVWPMRLTPTWCGARPGTPDLNFAKKFAEAIRDRFPGKLLAYNCSPSFNWKKNLDDATIAKFQRELGAMGYKYQFITLAGIHNMWYHVRSGAGLCETRHVRLCREGAGTRICRPRPWLHLRVPPAGSGHWLLRRHDHRDSGRVSSVTALTGSTESSSTDRRRASPPQLPAALTASTRTGPPSGFLRWPCNLTFPSS